MYWTISGHTIALVGESFYDYDGSGWVVLRCLGCPPKPEGGCVHKLWAAEEVGDEWIVWEPVKMVDGVIDHLNATGAPVPPEIAQAARTLASLSGDWDDGIDLIQDHFGGGERLFRDWPTF